MVYTGTQTEWSSGPCQSEGEPPKHGVRFADAVMALEDGNGITVREEREDEDRWVTLGMDALGRILVVVYTWRGEKVRLISARLAAARERRQYDRGV